MNEPAYSTSDSTSNSQTTPGSSLPQNILSRVKELLLTPDLAWDKIKSEPTSIFDIYKSYFIFIAAISPIFSWIKFSVIGISILGYTVRTGFFGGIVAGIFNYIASLVMIYISAVVLEKLAPKFEAKTDLTSTFKLLAYSGTPAAITSVFVIVPALGLLIMIAGAGYSIYLFFKGLPKLVDISQEKRAPYLVSSIIVTFLIGFVTFAIVNLIAPSSQNNVPPVSTGNQNIDLNKLEQSIKEMQKNLPKP